jgi:hypothetical protein
MALVDCVVERPGIAIPGRCSCYVIHPTKSHHSFDQTIPSFAVLANNSDCDDRQLLIGVLARTLSWRAWLVSLVNRGNTAFARALAFLINATADSSRTEQATRAQTATG